MLELPSVEEFNVRSSCSIRVSLGKHALNAHSSPLSNIAIIAPVNHQTLLGYSLIINGFLMNVILKQHLIMSEHSDKRIIIILILSLITFITILNTRCDCQTLELSNIESLRHLLLRQSYQNCCPSWNNLIENDEIQTELKKKSYKGGLKIRDLLNEIRTTFVNVTYLSIDGQSGEDEREKYYRYYDSIQYYLRLAKVASNLIDDSTSINGLNTDNITTTSIGSSNITSTRTFKRHLKSMQFKVSQDPLIASFVNELFLDNGRMNPNFDYYEDFLKSTIFGQYYAKNISMIRESVLKFDRTCNHLMSINFTSTLTRPSTKYKTIRRLSHELYEIQNELENKIATRILSNRSDIDRIFKKLNELAKSHPYIRMLGDEYHDDPPHSSDDVTKLTHLLDEYLSNNMTEWVFYDKLHELPEEFIRLGSTISNEFETREVPRFSRFDSNYLGNRFGAHRSLSWTNSFNLSGMINPSGNVTKPNSSSPRTTAATSKAGTSSSSGGSLLSRFFSSN